jgi:NAD-dependent dihydropyrimidine dehydrogenase PreA subunit
MVLRNIVKIDEEKCDGCAQCVDACAEGAIEIIDGKAKVISEIYCDGLGACIGHCPQDAITIEQREAEKFDEQATEAHLAEKKSPQQKSGFVCPGTMARKLRDEAEAGKAGDVAAASQLGQWPVQLMLVSPQAPYFAGSDLLLVADCVPFAMGDFHDKFLKNHSIAIGCPKLDDSQFYIEKLAQIIEMNKLKSLTVIHMEVPCCSGLTHITKEAIAKSQTKMTFEDVTIGLKGNIMKTETIDK